MKRILLYVLVMFAAVVVLPMIITAIFPAAETKLAYENSFRSSSLTTGKANTGTFSPIHSTMVSKTNENPLDEIPLDENPFDVALEVNVLTTGNKIVSVPLEEYVKGVVASEMPAKFELEALKAQAVVSRTLAIHHMNSDVHMDADVCDSYLHCQQWKPFDNKSGYGDMIERAVEETKGLVIFFNGEPINAFFHSNSCGRTENVEDVWDCPPIPYLKSVISYGEKNNSGYFTTIEFNTNEMLGKLFKGLSFMEISALENNFTGLQIVFTGYTSGGRVRTVNIGGHNFKGTEVRELLGLKSSCFTMSISEDGKTVRIITEGSGHGVGLSQWGANYLSSIGKKYDEIIQHYYQSVQIKKFQSFIK